MLGSAIKKYLEVNNLNEIKLDNKLAIEIIKDAHDKWELVTTIPQHALADSIRKKCGEKFETMIEKQTRVAKEQKATLKEKARQMQAEIKKKHEEEMKKELAYFGVDEDSITSLDDVEANTTVSNAVSSVEIIKGTMDGKPKEAESDFIGNISAPVEEVVEKTIEAISEANGIIENGVKEAVKEAKKEVAKEIVEAKEIIEETVKEAKKELEVDIDEILDNL